MGCVALTLSLSAVSCGSSDKQDSKVTGIGGSQGNAGTGGGGGTTFGDGGHDPDAGTCTRTPEHDTGCNPQGFGNQQAWDCPDVAALQAHQSEFGQGCAPADFDGGTIPLCCPPR